MNLFTNSNEHQGVDRKTKCGKVLTLVENKVSFSLKFDFKTPIYTIIKKTFIILDKLILTFCCDWVVIFYWHGNGSFD